jgi:hypothetical protein
VPKRLTVRTARFSHSLPSDDAVAEYHHIYPFSPWGLHGGTLRLRTALEQRCVEGTATFSWWDRARQAWRSDTPVESVGTADPEPTPEARASTANRLKRWVFPSTLWEAGWRPRSALGDLHDEPPARTIVLHTTLVAPLAARLRESGRRVVVDVHDAIFRGHLDDAKGASAAMWATRRAYAATVRHRERLALAPAHRLAVAGWDDMRLLADMGLTRATWSPTGLDARSSTMPESAQLCVGLLGNFHHGPTARAASELISSPLGRDPTVQLILGGIGSERYATSSRARSLGQVATVDEFYDQIHATVVPVMNGTGMKCKLAEAALSGKAVVTTRLGALGYPPELSRAFVVVDGAHSLSRRTITDAIERLSPDAVRASFESVVGREAAARTYASALARAQGRDGHA